MTVAEVSCESEGLNSGCQAWQEHHKLPSHLTGHLHILSSCPLSNILQKCSPQAGFELTVQIRLSSNVKHSSCFSFLGVELTDMAHHACLRFTFS